MKPEESSNQKPADRAGEPELATASCSGLLCCDECGRIHEDHIDAFPICECGRDKSRMEWATTDQVVAHEYGRLDQKYNMGYSPRPKGAEKSYAMGYRLRESKEDHDLASYKESLNHGWH